jgi:hypothetical protein
MMTYRDLQDSIVVQQLWITNDSENDVFVINASVETDDGKSIEPRFPRTADEKTSHWTVPKVRSLPVSARWEFYPHMSADEVLGRRATWIWGVRIGTKEHVLRVAMEED